MSRIFRRTQSTKSHNAVKEVLQSDHEGQENGWKEGDMDKTDPSAVRFDVFYNHWGQVGTIMLKNTSGFSSHFHSGRVSPDEVQSVMSYLRQMVQLLVEEDPPAPPDQGKVGRILQYANEQNIFERLLVWGQGIGEHSQDIQHELLRSFESVIGQARQQVLFQDKVLNGLLRLLLNCWESCSEFLEPQLLLLLHQLCVSLTKDQVLLEYFFHASPSKGPARFLLFSLLIPFIHREGCLGQQARDALLLCISASRDAEHIAKYIADSTSLCPVLAGGLGALYSRLPRKLDIPADNWHCLTFEDVAHIPELCMFLNSLEFCNAVVQVSHPIVSDQLLQFFHDGFLVPVVGPALHQPPNDEITAATAYVQLFIRSITDPRLIRVFLEYLLRGWHDNNKIVDSLLKRIAADSSKLCLVTLSLMHTLVNLNCEDVMMELIFQHLIPCNHIMASQKRAILDVSQVGVSAQKFLSLVPNCCTNVISSPPPNASIPPSPYMVHLEERGRVVYQSSQEDLLAPPKPRTRTISSSGSSTGEEYNTSLLEYLDDAREGIHECSRGCRRWVGLYDGIHPSATSFGPISPSYSTASNTTGSRFFSPNRPTSFTSNRLSSTPSSGQPGQNGPSQSGHNHTPGQKESGTTKKRRRGPSADGLFNHGHASKSGNLGVLNTTIQEILTLDLGDVRSMDISDVNLMDIFQGEELNILSQVEEVGEKQTRDATCASSSNPVGPNLDHHKRISMSSDSAFSSNYSPTTDVAADSRQMTQQRLHHHPSSHPGSSQGSSQEDFRGGASPSKYPPTEGSLKSPISSQSSLREGDEPSVFYMYDSDYDAAQGGCNLPRDAFFEEADEILIALGYKTGEESPYGTRDLRHLQSLTESDMEGEASLSFSQHLNSPGRDTLHSSGSSDGGSSPEDMKFHFPADGNQNGIPGMTVPLGRLRSESMEEPLTPRAFHKGDMNGNLFTSEPPYSPIGKVSSHPDTGPFINILLKKLEAMMQNSLYMNLLLTGLITRLAYYPQPLLRSFLLNTNMVFQPSVKSLVQVITSVRTNLDAYAATVDDWDQKILLARQYLWCRESGATPARDRSATIMDGNQQAPQRPRAATVLSPSSNKKSFGDFFRRGKRKGDKARDGQRLSVVGESIAQSTTNKVSEQERVRTKNAVYCAVVFEEFMRELAATCQEHVVGAVEDEWRRV